MASKLESQIINYLAAQPGTTIELPNNDSFTDPYSISEREIRKLFERLGYSRLEIVAAIENLVGRGTLLNFSGALMLSWALSFKNAARDLRELV